MIIIKLIQDTLNKTQQDIADDLGVSRQTISMWYSGYKISNKNLINIERVYNIPSDILTKSQISGISLTKEDIDRIKLSLLNNISDSFNENIILKLLYLLNQNILYKSEHFSVWLNKINRIEKYHIYDNLSINDIPNVIKDDTVLLIIHKHNKSLIEIFDYYRNVINNKKVCFIVVESFNDKNELIIFGGNYEDKNC